MILINRNERKKAWREFFMSSRKIEALGNVKKALVEYCHNLMNTAN